MRQEWKHLLFLHWEWPAAAIQRTLPEGLEVDCWNGRAFVGFVPFFMCQVRPVGCPALPWLSNFLELNVRTYVRDRNGRPGVWFYSLDCNQPIAVRVARTFFHLPYFDASMKARLDGERVSYSSRRAGSSTDCRVSYQPSGPHSAAEMGSLEEFLVERYRLFAQKGTTLLTGCVWHDPYRISPATFTGSPDEPLSAAGFDPERRQPIHAVYSRGVDVRIFPIERANR